LQAAAARLGDTEANAFAVFRDDRKKLEAAAAAAEAALAAAVAAGSEGAAAEQAASLQVPPRPPCLMDSCLSLMASCIVHHPSCLI
jgi:hypothetical protein